MGICISVCLAQTDIGKAMDIAEQIKLGTYLSRKVRPGFYIREGFTETGALYHTYDLAELSPGAEGKYCPDKDLKVFIASEIAKWLKEKKPVLFNDGITIFHEIYIGDQLSRNIAAWIMGCEIVVTPHGKTGKNDAPFDKDTVDVFTRKVCEIGGVIKVDTVIPAEIEELYRRFAVNVMGGVGTFDMSACMDKIYAAILANPKKL